MAAIIPIPAFTDNYIWLMREGRQAAVVDPGEAAPVRAYLDAEGLELSAIIVTHHHWDHVNGIEGLLADRAIPVFGPARETIPRRTHALAEGDSFVIPGVGVELSVLDVPGHTAGQLAYVGDNDGKPLTFTGDTLFACGCGRVFEGTPAQMSDSLAKLAALPGDTKMYCGHEYTLANLRFALAVEPDNAALRDRLPREQAKRDRGLPTVPSTMADEMATNPFLRTSEPAVVAAAERQAGRKLDGPVDVFATLREWKNGFR